MERAYAQGSVNVYSSSCSSKCKHPADEANRQEGDESIMKSIYTINIQLLCFTDRHF